MNKRLVLLNPKFVNQKKMPMQGAVQEEMEPEE